MKNVLEYLENSASAYPDRVAVTDEHGHITYRELYEVCRRVGAAMADRIRIGRPVAVIMEKGIKALCAFWGTVYPLEYAK